MIFRLIFIIFSSLAFDEMKAQMPTTNIIFFEYDFVDDSIVIKNKSILSSGHGYNNQPSFSSDCKKVYYTSNRSDSLNTDVFAYDIRKAKHSNITNTPLSEYSPTQDLSDQHSIWFVRVESDKKQQLRKFDWRMSTIENKCMVSDSIGYFALSDGSDLGLIILNRGLEFHTFSDGDSKTKLIRTNTGRFIDFDKSTNSYWFHGFSADGDHLYRYDRNTKAIVDSIPALQECKDYGIDNNGHIFGGYHGELFRYISKSEMKWVKISDLKLLSGDFYRLSFCNCGKHFCVVTFEGKKP
jgi:tricorn protease-like protein